MADLVALLQYGFGHRRMRLDRPAGDEERRLQPEIPQKLEQLRRSDARLISAKGHGDEAFGMRRVLAGPGALGIDVEGEEHRGATACRATETAAPAAPCSPARAARSPSSYFPALIVTSSTASAERPHLSRIFL